MVSRPRSLVPDRREVLAGLAVAAFSVCYLGAQSARPRRRTSRTRVPLVVGEPVARATVVGVLAVLLGATALQLALTRAGTDRTTRLDAAAPIVER